jgi:hypothetical protein
MNDQAKKYVLNAGSGGSKSANLLNSFKSPDWTEVRLDIDPTTQPDILGSFADMRGVIEDARFDALFSSHAVEHLYAHEVIPAFREFRRVVKPDGFAVVTCPDLAAIARQLLERGAEEIAYNSPAGPIRPIDMLFGYSQAIAEGRLHMAHNTGFTAPRLARVGLVAGFSEVRVMEGGRFDLWAIMLGPQASIPSISALFENTALAGLFDESHVVRQDAAAATSIGGPGA